MKVAKKKRQKLLTGEELEARLQIHERIGGGSTARVYRGTLDGVTPVAVKVLHPHAAQREATLQVCRHIVKLHALAHLPPSFGGLPTRRFTWGIVTEYMDAGAMTRMLALALQFLHAQTPPVVHRDIKTENVLMGTIPGTTAPGGFAAVATSPSLPLQRGGTEPFALASAGSGAGPYRRAGSREGDSFSRANVRPGQPGYEPPGVGSSRGGGMAAARASLDLLLKGRMSGNEAVAAGRYSGTAQGGGGGMGAGERGERGGGGTAQGAMEMLSTAQIIQQLQAGSTALPQDPQPDPPPDPPMPAPSPAPPRTCPGCPSSLLIATRSSQAGPALAWAGARASARVPYLAMMEEDLQLDVVSRASSSAATAVGSPAMSAGAREAEAEAGVTERSVSMLMPMPATHGTHGTHGAPGAGANASPNGSGTGVPPGIGPRGVSASGRVSGPGRLSNTGGVARQGRPIRAPSFMQGSAQSSHSQSYAGSPYAGEYPHALWQPGQQHSAVLRDEPYNEKVDVFSFGVVLYENPADRPSMPLVVRQLELALEALVEADAASMAAQAMSGRPGSLLALTSDGGLAGQGLGLGGNGGASSPLVGSLGGGLAGTGGGGTGTASAVTTEKQRSSGRSLASHRSLVEDDIRQFFAPYDLKGISFVYEPDGRPSGLAFAEFVSKEEALKALSKNGEYIGQRYVRLLHVPRAEMEEQVRLGTLAIPGAAAKIRSRMMRSQQRNMGYMAGPVQLMPSMMPGGRPVMGMGPPGGIGAPYGQTAGPGQTPVESRLWQPAYSQSAYGGQQHAGLQGAGGQGGLSAAGQQSGLGTATSPTIKIRGLPYGSSPSEILAFFQTYHFLPDTLQIGLDQLGRPSGEAWLSFTNPQEALRATTTVFGGRGPQTPSEGGMHTGTGNWVTLCEACSNVGAVQH
eukprot:XP_001692268.1 predicted protein [Chlamydomonas reinhardtii]